MSQQPAPPPPIPPIKPAGAQSGNTVLVIVALVMGLVTVLLTNVYIRQIRQEAEGREMRVWILLKNMELGEKLKASKHLRAESVPEKFKDTYSGRVDKLDNYDGRSFEQPAREGAILTTAMFVEGDGQRQLEVPEGQRAVVLPISSRIAPGMLRPGTFIDIHASFTTPGQPPRIHWVLQKAKVAAVGTRTAEGSSSGSRSFSTITIFVDEAQTEAILTVNRFVGEKGFDITLLNPLTPRRHLGVNPEVLAILGLD